MNDCPRCGAPMDEEIGLGWTGDMQAVYRCRCGGVLPLAERQWDRAEVRRRIAIVRGQQ